MAGAPPRTGYTIDPGAIHNLSLTITMALARSYHTSYSLGIYSAY